MQRLSVIIPARNEAALLPGLLDALRAQTRPPDEVIVADAGSTDGTAELARAGGATVVGGGMPGPGRNAGARAATGDAFQFFDADVLPSPDFLGQAWDEFEREGYAVATCLMAPTSDDPAEHVLVGAANLYMQVVQPISPRAPGFCILALRSVHEAIGGFDESLAMSEDHDYVRRASRHGEFGVLAGVRIPVSLRRVDREGLPGLALKYLWCEMHALAGLPVRATPFSYEMGGGVTPRPPTGKFLTDVAELRAQLAHSNAPIPRLTRAGMDQLHSWLEMKAVDTTVEAFRLLLEGADLDTLDRYLDTRLALGSEGRVLNRSWSKIRRAPQEVIRLLEPNGPRPRRPGRRQGGQAPRGVDRESHRP